MRQVFHGCATTTEANPSNDTRRSREGNGIGDGLDRKLEKRSSFVNAGICCAVWIIPLSSGLT